MSVPLLIGRLAAAFIGRSRSTPPSLVSWQRRQPLVLRTLFEHLPLAAAVVDEHDIVLAVNPAFTELFGYSADEAIGQPIGPLIVPEELRSEGLHFTESALAGEPINTETVRQCRNRLRIPVWLRAVPIRLSGRYLGVLALYQDIRPLHEHRQRLTEPVQELQHLNAAKDRLLAVISHDLRAPLATAQSLAGLILAEAHSPEAVIEHATKLQRLLSDQLELVNELLEFARSEEGHSTLQRSALDLCEVLIHALDSVTLLAYSKQIRLVPKLPEMGIPMEGDPHKLRRVFTNLLSNAVKFTPEHGAVEIEAWVEYEGSSLPIVVQIRDTGIGIPPEHLPSLFVPYAAAQRQGTRGERGVGLGLAIVKRFVELHGGTIELHSVPEHGTTVTLRFPQAPPAR
ncbi:MAG: PAS domain-containing sensor histidine kinase [Candidatus Kapabacteria bacterium]|nr:PAS domain-containing sensor histidine kinase [Candidatus Kapabacteria bacterium]MDW8012071.1 PAS domain-containing sensor histidine kinase [Bacteroidota bacterium]